MNGLHFLIAWRYLLGTRLEKNISAMVRICFIGIMIGSFALALIIAVMNGFEKVTHEKMQGIHSQIIIRGYGDHLNIEQLNRVLHKEFPEVIGASPNATKQVILQERNSDDISNIVFLKGIDPAAEARVSILEKKLHTATGDKTLTAILQENHILIGNKLAQELDVMAGEPINILFAEDEHARKRKISLAKHDAILGGTFKTGIEEFDSGLAFCSMNFLQQLLPDAGPTQINLKLQPDADEDAVIQRLRDRFNLEVYSWKDLYPALVSALKLEKYAMFLILALITLVASMNIISLLFMQITQKRGDIAILKAMGMADGNIQSIFVIMGMAITGLASITGLILAFIAGLILQWYPFIELPDVYYVTHLPVRMEPNLFALVFLVVIVLSFLSTWIPARRTKKINIAHVLRFEA